MASQVSEDINNNSDGDNNFENIKINEQLNKHAHSMMMVSAEIEACAKNMFIKMKKTSVTAKTEVKVLIIGARCQKSTQQLWYFSFNLFLFLYNALVIQL